MALAYSTRTSELQVLQQLLLSVPEVEQAYAQSGDDSLRVLVILPDHDESVERRLAEIEGQMIDSFPWLDVDFDVVLRGNRQLSDVVDPKGFQIFTR